MHGVGKRHHEGKTSCRWMRFLDENMCNTREGEAMWQRHWHKRLQNGEGKSLRTW